MSRGARADVALFVGLLAFACVTSLPAVHAQASSQSCSLTSQVVGKVAVIASGRTYYIATLKNGKTAYITATGAPVTDPQLVREIGVIDFVHQNDSPHGIFGIDTLRLRAQNNQDSFHTHLKLRELNFIENELGDAAATAVHLFATQGESLPSDLRFDAADAISQTLANPNVLASVLMYGDYHAAEAEFALMERQVGQGIDSYVAARTFMQEAALADSDTAGAAALFKVSDVTDETTWSYIGHLVQSWGTKFADIFNPTAKVGKYTLAAGSLLKANTVLKKAMAVPMFVDYLNARKAAARMDEMSLPGSPSYALPGDARYTLSLKSLACAPTTTPTPTTSPQVTAWQEVQQPPLLIPSTFVPSMNQDGTETVTEDSSTGLFQMVNPLTGVTGLDVTGCNYTISGSYSDMLPSGVVAEACASGDTVHYNPSTARSLRIPPPPEWAQGDGYVAYVPNSSEVVAAPYGGGGGNWLAVIDTPAGTTQVVTFPSGTVDVPTYLLPPFAVKGANGDVLGVLDGVSGPESLWSLDPVTAQIVFQAPLNPSCDSSGGIVAVAGGSDVAVGNCIYSATDGSFVTSTDMQTVLGGGSGEVVGLTATGVEVLDPATGQSQYDVFPAAWQSENFADAQLTGDNEEVVGLIQDPNTGETDLASLALGSGTFSTVPVSMDYGTYSVDYSDSAMGSALNVSGDGRTAEMLITDYLGNVYGIFFHR